VDFIDQQMGSDGAQYFKDLFFSTGKIPTGSVTEYYNDVSGGKISLTGEVLGPYRMPLTLKNYANGESGFSDAEPNLQTLAGHALDAANSHIDLKPYDNDGNGQVDAFIVVHAGAGAEVDGDVNKIWSAKWNLVGAGQNVDGVNVSAFLTIPEDARLGVCAHELGHLLFGWPDFYDIDLPENRRDPNRIGIRSAGIGSWCLMAGGSWGRLPGTPWQDAGNTPCHPSAWCKVNQGWVTLLNETNNRFVSLKDVKGPPREVHRLWTNGDLASKEYFLMENRQLKGFDRSLPGPGLLGE
jgi:immune inhibitor A